MRLEFTKMQGAGNDFVVIDAVTRSVSLKTSQIRKIADRHRGIGCDQILLVEPPDDPEAEFRYRIFNADGSEAGQCGNGARCFARFVRDKRLSLSRSMTVQTANGNMQLEILDDGRISANLGAPGLRPEDVPFITDNDDLEHELETEGEAYQVGVVSMGNPHAVLFVNDIARAPVQTLGPRIERHPRFPDRANVGFAEVVSQRELRLRVWERGAGETLACGSGACAAVVQACRLGLVGSMVTVHLPGGKLIVEWRGQPDDPVWLGGPTATVFDGTIKLRGH